MTEYVQRELGISEEEADKLRRHYWQRYGATLKGLMRHHGTRPEHFLWHTHQFPELPKMVLRDPRLRHMLKRLPGRKLLYSNAPRHYVYDVLQLLRIEDAFEDVFAIEHARFRPKPEVAGFMRLLSKHGLNPAQCVMVEDSAENLQTAKRLGMKTVLVGEMPRKPAYVDFSIRSVLDLPRILPRLM
jgi:putative hydrolase of the HAD superfamily